MSVELNASIFPSHPHHAPNSRIFVFFMFHLSQILTRSLRMTCIFKIYMRHWFRSVTQRKAKLRKKFYNNLHKAYITNRIWMKIRFIHLLCFQYFIYFCILTYTYVRIIFKFPINPWTSEIHSSRTVSFKILKHIYGNIFASEYLPLEIDEAMCLDHAVFHHNIII